MNKVLLFFCLIILLSISCEDQEILSPPIYPECVPEEPITSQDSTIYVFFPGDLQYGSLSFILENKLITASSEVHQICQNKICLLYRTYSEENNPFMAAESIIIEISLDAL